MRHLPTDQFEVVEKNKIEVGSPESASADLVASGSAWAWPVTTLIASGIVLMAAIALGTAILVFNFRDRVLANSERELKNTALILVETIHRSFQAVELVQISLIERMQALAIASSEDYERQMSGYDVHLLLRDKISGLPHVDAIAMIDAQGKLINFSRYWPIPAINVADRDYFKALKFDPHLTSFVSEPVRSRATGTWTIYLARKFTGQNGEFLGLVLGAMEVAYFEEFFKSIALTGDSAINLFRRDGILLARYPHIESIIGGNFAQHALFQKVLLRADRGAMRAEFAIDGKDRLIAASNAAHYPIAIAVAASVSDVLADWRTEAGLLIGAGTIAGSIIALVFIVIVRQLLQGHRWSRQKLAEERLRLDSALNNMSQGLLMFDSSKRIVICNRRYIEMYRLSPDIVKPGCTTEALIRHRKETGSFAGDVEKYCATLDEMVASGTETIRVVETPDGRSIHIVNRPMAGGGRVVTHEDVTRKTQAERAIRESENKFSDLFEFSPDGLVLCDERGVIQLINSQAEKLFGYESKELIGQSMEILVPEELRGRHVGLRSRHSQISERRSMGQAHADITGLRKDGTVFSADISISPIHTAGGKMVCAAVRDITEQKQHEASFRLLFENNPLPMYVFDTETYRFLAVNDAALAHYGYGREQFLAMSVLDIRPREDREWFVHALKTFGSYQRADCRRHLKSDGTTFEIDIYSRELKYNNRAAQFAVVVDVTERRRAERELDQNREFLNQIIDNVPMAIFVKEASERRIVLMNRATEELWGLSRSEALGKCTSDLFPKAQADQIAERDEELLQSNSVLFTDAHLNFARPDDGRIVTSRRLVIRDKDGRPQYLVIVVEDVTAQKTLEKERDNNQRFLDTIVENIPSTIVVKNAHDLRYVLVNRAGEKYFGIPRDQMIGRTAHEIFSEVAADYITRLDKKLLETYQDAIIDEHTLEMPDHGKRVALSKRRPIMNENGEPQYVLVVVDDITERKGIEQQLRQAQKMEAVGKLTGGLAHDFNNLLTIIIGNLDVLQNDIAGNRPAEQKVETILQASERGAELTRQMLAFSRRQPLQPKRLDINEIVSKVVRLLTRTLGEEINVDVQTAVDVWSALVDAAQLEAVLVNIAINARDAMPSGGRLHIRTCNRHVDANYATRHAGLTEGDYVVIEVSDTGAGMPPEVLARIFEPFFTTKAPGKGTGLGLSMVYGFMKQSGGHVSVASEVGKGATFSLLLPRASSAEAEAEAEAEEKAKAKAKAVAGRTTQEAVQLAEQGEVILAVDDNSDVRKIAVDQLREFGYQVLEAANAEMALERLDGAAKIDLLFTDIVMPGRFNGKELAEIARGKRPNLKVLLTSGFPGTSQIDHTDLELGHALLSKPYRKHELAKAVRSVLDQPKKSSSLEELQVRSHNDEPLVA